MRKCGCSATHWVHRSTLSTHFENQTMGRARQNCFINVSGVEGPMQTTHRSARCANWRQRCEKRVAPREIL
eukprot:11212431-Lingulodinium_polyedra.AAC.1